MPETPTDERPNRSRLRPAIDRGAQNLADRVDDGLATTPADVVAALLP